MGFSVERVVSALKSVDIDPMGGEDCELGETYLDDITTKLLENA
jgi:hypothetical protein